MEGDMLSYQRILVPLDQSDQSETVFKQALGIAQANQGKLMLIHCIPLEQRITPYGSLYGEELLNISSLLREQLEREKSETQLWLTGYQEKAAQAGIQAEWDYKTGEAGYWIREIARTWPADLVVMGRRGLSGLKEMFLGSVSNYIVHHVPCSVLIVQGNNI
jgi:nucleotide-binding universal stress UspA family protein